MKYVILSILLSTFLVGFSQNASIKTIFKKAAPKQTMKIIMDMSEYDASTVNLFKEKLSTVKKSIEVVHYDDSSFLLTIVYNNNMSLEYFTALFNEYKISYLIKNPILKVNKTTL